MMLQKIPNVDVKLLQDKSLQDYWVLMLKIQDAAYRKSCIVRFSDVSRSSTNLHKGPAWDLRFPKPSSRPQEVKLGLHLNRVSVRPLGDRFRVRYPCLEVAVLRICLLCLRVIGLVNLKLEEKRSWWPKTMIVIMHC